MAKKSIDRVAVSVQGLSYTGSTKAAYELMRDLEGEGYGTSLLTKLWEALRQELQEAGVIDAKGNVIKVPEL